MGLKLYLVRHGQTDHSRENAFCGALDAPLTADGHRMAEALAEHWGHLPLQAIYASNKTRAIHTATPIAKRLGLTVKVDADLREIEYGKWEGLGEEQVQGDQPGAFKAWQDHPDLISPPGGENAVQIAARANAAIARIRAAHSDGAVMAVSHKATIRILVCSLLGIPVGEFRRRIAQPVAAVNVIEFKATGALVHLLGETAYLPEALRGARGT
jgi:alpha-ribazole phosphatase